jgi:tetrahydromethanopterin S-methyltransferase subunit B
MKFDTNITWALVLAIALETAGGLIWAGAAAQRLDAVELRVADMREVNSRMARLEVQIADMRAQLDRLETKLDQGEGRRR